MAIEVLNLVDELTSGDMGVENWNSLNFNALPELKHLVDQLEALGVSADEAAGSAQRHELKTRVDNIKRKMTANVPAEAQTLKKVFRLWKSFCSENTTISLNVSCLRVFMRSSLCARFRLVSHVQASVAVSFYAMPECI